MRAGSLYKQLLYRGVEVNPAIAAESLLVADSIRTRFIATGRRAMQDIPHDSLVALTEGIFAFAGTGVIPGAVRLRDGWLLLGSGADHTQATRAMQRLAREGGRVVATLLTSTSPTVLGGARALADSGSRFIVPSSSLGAARVMLGGRESRARPFDIIASGRWLRIAGDSVWVEELDIPDARGAVLLWIPRLRWAWLGPLGRPWPLRQGLRVLEERGFAPAMIGTAQALARPAAEVR